MSKRSSREEEAAPAKRSRDAAASCEHDGKSPIHYDGWTVPHNNYYVPTINIEDVTPETFYNDYVKRRRPVVLQGALADMSRIGKWVETKYLEERAGDQSVMVEKRPSANDPFGKGNEVRMTFREFLRLVKGGDDKHYLTTQDVRANSDGRPDLMSPLMKALRGDFPVRPALMGHLVPQDINMWIGNSEEGASSGLHHDYHDNLYVLLAGRKRFRLFGPRDAAKMYTRGKLLKVHPNGRINYEGEETTAYGADLRSDAAALASRRKDEAERRLEEAERALDDGEPGAKEQFERAEEELERAMDVILDAEMGGEDDDGDDVGACEEQYGDEGRLVDKTVKNPNNFSRVEADILDDEEKLRESYPEFLDAKVAWASLSPGRILYLPASWFHEVTSYASPGGRSGHIAVNYWFHPPDGDSYRAPYSTPFWANDFAARGNDPD
ncbi:hypothetical protein ACHAWF_010267 [Thalassiosira exigua]